MPVAFPRVRLAVRAWARLASILLLAAWQAAACAPLGFVRSVPSRTEPPFRLQIGPDRGVRDVVAQITGPDGAVTWSCAGRVPSRRRLRTPSTRVPCRAATGWWRGAGRYRLAVSVDGTSTAVDFDADGSESLVSTMVSAYPDSVDAFIDSIHPAPRGLTLLRDWVPTPQGFPEYTVRNGSSQPVLGGAWRHQFYGHVEVEHEGEWERFARGGGCGSVPEAAPLDPGETAVSSEGGFLTEVSPFTPGGRYRYVVTASAVPAPPMSARARHLWALADEFTIHPDAARIRGSVDYLDHRYPDPDRAPPVGERAIEAVLVATLTAR
jgi:hypothetical protein